MGVLCLLRFIVDSSYSIMAPFFPQILENKGIPQDYNGYIFSTFSAALIVAAPIVGYSLDKFERQKFLQIGLLILGFTMMSFGFSSYINDTTTYLVIIFISRAF